MTQFTPEEIRDAAAVVRAYGAPPHVRLQSETETMFRTARMLDGIAARTECEQAEQAQREKRIEQLAAEILLFAGGSTPLDTLTPRSRRIYIDTARQLLDRYPALAEAPESTR